MDSIQAQETLTMRYHNNAKTDEGYNPSKVNPQIRLHTGWVAQECEWKQMANIEPTSDKSLMKCRQLHLSFAST